MKTGKNSSLCDPMMLPVPFLVNSEHKLQSKVNFRWEKLSLVTWSTLPPCLLGSIIPFYDNFQWFTWSMQFFADKSPSDFTNYSSTFCSFLDYFFWKHFLMDFNEWQMRFGSQQLTFRGKNSLQFRNLYTHLRQLE